ncbi:MAG TPA: riboflavin synthase [Polyangiaceae bacterium]
MFTGLVAGMGKLLVRERRGPGYRVVIGTQGLDDFERLELGESIAVNGACLTVVASSPASFDADVSLETAQKTTLGRLPLGRALNLERSLRVGDRLGGHWVTGHVDGVARVLAVEAEGEAWRVRIGFDAQQQRFIAAKGSVALDGVSLTVNEVRGLELEVMLIPHTRQVTNLEQLGAGSELNLEVDLVARYLVGYLEGGGQKPVVESFSLALERAGYK